MEYLIIVAVLGTLLNYAISNSQQDREFEEQEDLLRKQQNFTREREDLAYERSRPGSQMKDLLDAGFNPSLAAQSVLGGDAATSQATSSPTAPTVNSAIQAMESMIGQGGQNIYDAWMNQIRAKNIEANTNKTEVEAGLLPRDYELRAMSTESQIGLWNASIEKIAKENDLTNEQIELAKQQNMYYGRMAESDLALNEKRMDQMVAEAKLANEKAKTESHVRSELDARAALEGEQVYTERAKQSELYAQVGLEEAQKGAVSTEQQIRAIDLEWVQKYDVPLTVDGQKYVAGLLAKGEYDKASVFLHSLTEIARGQELGKNLGGMKTHIQMPLNLFSKDYPTPALRGVVNSPFWNPQK